VQNVVDRLNSKHERMILISDLVFPAAETAPGMNAQRVQLREELLQDAITLQGGGGVTVVEAPMVNRHNLVIGVHEGSVYAALDRLRDEIFLVDRLHGRLGNLHHQGPIWATLLFQRVRPATVGLSHGRQLDAGLRLVVGRVIAKDRGPVERAIVLREVKPAFITNILRSGTRIPIPTTCVAE